MGNSQEKTSPFNSSSTAEQTARDVDLSGKNVIVTGGNTGIGIETARVLAARGAHVVIACRSPDKGQKAVEEIKAKLPNAHVESMKLDLASLASVREFADEFKRMDRPLHILINNAGVMACPYQKTADGFEMQFGTNHLGHFLLTNLLVEPLERGAPSRVVVVSSHAHTASDVKFDNLQGDKGYSAFNAYSQSKTANILFANEFNKRFQSRGIYANSLHPGVINTEVSRHSTAAAIFYNVSDTLRLIKTIPQGAATQVYVATAPELEKVGGKYFSDCNEAVPKPYAVDPAIASQLWDISAELVHLSAN